MHYRRQQQPQSIHHNVTFASLYRNRGRERCNLAAGDPFSVVFTDWLSMTAALGLAASRPWDCRRLRKEGVVGPLPGPILTTRCGSNGRTGGAKGSRGSIRQEQPVGMAREFLRWGHAWRLRSRAEGYLTGRPPGLGQAATAGVSVATDRSGVNRCRCSCFPHYAQPPT